ncbi:MAG: hypothetical protein QMC95_14910, partial [Desulfitobacteriaceae bacterium]|nr:hypothetical protein [Desulfitobacteriaceae bacterium]
HFRHRSLDVQLELNEFTFFLLFNLGLFFSLTTKSIKKLTEYDIETVICYNGGLYKDNINQRIADLAMTENQEGPRGV